MDEIIPAKENAEPGQDLIYADVPAGKYRTLKNVPDWIDAKDRGKAVEGMKDMKVYEAALKAPPYPWERDPIPGGSAPKWTPERIQVLMDRIDKFYEDHPDACTLDAFPAHNRMGTNSLIDLAADWPAIKLKMSAIKTLCRYRLADKGLKNQQNSAMSIFALKQLGWTDKLETSTMTDVRVSLELDDKTRAVLRAALASVRPQVIDIEQGTLPVDNPVDEC